MKLAEALILRADHQKRLTQLRSRISGNARIQEGEVPAEDPNALLSDFVQLSGELRQLIQQINRTNAATQVEAGKTISDAIAERDELQVLHAMYRDLAAAALIRQDRTTKGEVKFLSAVNVAQIQNQADDLAKRRRELDATIQALNWNIELMEN